jgi:hypothetical protein
MRRSRAFVVSASLVLGGCGDDGGGGNDGDGGPDNNDGWTRSVPLPRPLANNGAASVALEGGCMLFSTLGIGAGLDRDAITTDVFRWREGDDSWLALPAAPDPPRLATSAVGLAGDLYVLGGYSVDASFAEVSHDRLDRFDLEAGEWQALAPLPTPIDDAVAVAWRDRYIVVVSGWSNTANVADVQIYDAQQDRWSAATPFPGTAAFGHAGAIDGDALIVIDGAASSAGFPLVTQTWRGDLDPDNPTEIAWTDLGPHFGLGRYRGAGGIGAPGELWFHGGTSDPYNFDGLRYADGTPSAPIATTLVIETASGAMRTLEAPKPSATMDHRALVGCEGAVYSIGGMVDGPAATAEVWRYQIGGP